MKKSKPTLIGIPNGADKANNTLTKKAAKNIAEALGMSVDSFKPYNPGEDALTWHNSNKKAILNKVIEDINTARLSGGKDNPMLIALPEITDLTGVTEKTPVFVSAGRIVDQKGLDIFAKSIKEYFENYYKPGDEIPVFYVQGIGGEKYKNMILDIKQEIHKVNPDAAKRIVFADLFSQPGRYDGAKMMSDFSVMSSWFEPCGLVHKEIGLFSGAIPIVNKTGGLPEELTADVNVIISDFVPKQGSKATEEELKINAEKFAKAIDKAVRIHADEKKYGSMVKSMMESNFDWLRENGAMDKYLEIMTKLGVIKQDVRHSMI